MRGEASDNLQMLVVLKWAVDVLLIGQQDDLCYCSWGICLDHLFHNPDDRET